MASNGRYKGIAPGAKLIIVKVIDGKGNCRVSDAIAGIEWAVYNGADALSLSLGGINLGETDPPIAIAADNVASAGVVVYVTAGNRDSSENGGQVAETTRLQVDRSKILVDLSQAGSGNNRDVYYLLVPIVLALPPGLIASPDDGVKVITVGVTDSSGHITSFSGPGPTRDDRIKPDVVAYGVDIISIVPSGVKRPDTLYIYYPRESGTNLSAPVAAGLSALLLQADGNLTVAGAKAAMTRGSTMLNSSQSDNYEEYHQGVRMLDALSSPMSCRRIIVISAERFRIAGQPIVGHTGLQKKKSMWGWIRVQTDRTRKCMLLLRAMKTGICALYSFAISIKKPQNVSTGRCIRLGKPAAPARNDCCQ